MVDAVAVGCLVRMSIRLLSRRPEDSQATKVWQLGMTGDARMV